MNVSDESPLGTLWRRDIDGVDAIAIDGATLLLATPTELLALDALSGAMRWRFPAESDGGVVLAAGDAVVHYWSTDGYRRLDVSSGRRLQGGHSRRPDPMPSTTPEGVTVSDGLLTLHDEGRVVWRTALLGSEVERVTVWKDWILASGLAGLQVFSRSGGAEVLRVAVHGPMTDAGPILASEDRIFVPLSNQTIVCLTGASRDVRTTPQFAFESSFSVLGEFLIAMQPFIQETPLPALLSEAAHPHWRWELADWALRELAPEVIEIAGFDAATLRDIVPLGLGPSVDHVSIAAALGAVVDSLPTPKPPTAQQARRFEPVNRILAATAMAGAPRLALDHLPRQLESVSVFTDWRQADGYSSFWQLIWSVYAASWALGGFELGLRCAFDVAAQPNARRWELEPIRRRIPVAGLLPRIAPAMFATPGTPLRAAIEVLRHTAPEWSSPEDQLIELVGASTWDDAIGAADHDVAARLTQDRTLLILSSLSGAALLGATRATAANATNLDRALGAAQRSLARFVSRLARSQ